VKRKKRTLHPVREESKIKKTSKNERHVLTVNNASGSAGEGARRRTGKSAGRVASGSE
jgi:hypothetical protein